MSRSALAITGVCIFVTAVFAVALLFNPHFPARVLAGESSVGTWMSGTLLISCAVLSMVRAMQHGGWRWPLIAVFFAVLALDERFMFHEQLKERIIFTVHGASWWAYELPVIAGAMLGTGIVALLWRALGAPHRLWLVPVVVLGSASVVIDVLAAGVVWEESFKLVAEVVMVCVLIQGSIPGPRDKIQN